MIATYMLAKLLEFFDAAVYARLAWVSGHALKHVAGAMGVYGMVLALSRRQPLSALNR